MFHYLLIVTMATGIGFAGDEDHLVGSAKPVRRLEAEFVPGAPLGPLAPRFDLRACQIHDPASRPEDVGLLEKGEIAELEGRVYDLNHLVRRLYGLLRSPIAAVLRAAPPGATPKQLEGALRAALGKEQAWQGWIVQDHGERMSHVRAPLRALSVERADAIVGPEVTAAIRAFELGAQTAPEVAKIFARLKKDEERLALKEGFVTALRNETAERGFRADYPELAPWFASRAAELRTYRRNLERQRRSDEFSGREKQVATDAVEAAEAVAKESRLLQALLSGGLRTARGRLKIALVVSPTDAEMPIRSLQFIHVPSPPAAGEPPGAFVPMVLTPGESFERSTRFWQGVEQRLGRPGSTLARWLSCRESIFHDLGPDFRPEGRQPTAKEKDEEDRRRIAIIRGYRDRLSAAILRR